MRFDADKRRQLFAFPAMGMTFFNAAFRGIALTPKRIAVSGQTSLAPIGFFIAASVATKTAP